MGYKKILEHAIRDPVRKIFAIVFAFGLWIFVAIANNYEYQKNIKTIYTNLPESLIIVDSVSNIDVTFFGRGGALFSIWAAPPKAQCNLEESKVGDNIISTKELNVPLGYGPTSIDYTLESIKVTIDKKIAKQIAIDVALKGELKDGYAILDIAVLDTIQIAGPKKILDNLQELTTESLSIKNRSSSFEKRLQILIPSPFLELSKKTVTARVDIDTTLEKLFTDIPLKLVYTLNQRIVSEKTGLDSLIVEGSPSRIERLSTRDIEVTIRLTKLSTGEYELPAEIILPKYIKPIYSKPKRFKIRIY